MAAISTMSTGSGDGTTRRTPGPSGASAHPRPRARRTPSAGPYTGPTGLVGWAKAGSAGSTTTWVSSVARRSGHISRPSCCSSR